MSGAQTDQIAPTLAVARNATIASGVFDRYAATRSPGSTPILRNASASEATRWRSLRHERSASGLVSLA